MTIEELISELIDRAENHPGAHVYVRDENHDMTKEVYCTSLLLGGVDGWSIGLEAGATTHEDEIEACNEIINEWQRHLKRRPK